MRTIQPLMLRDCDHRNPVLITTDDQAELFLTDHGTHPAEFLLRKYWEFRGDGHSIQESLILADDVWFDEVAKPELESILKQLRDRRDK